MNIFVLLKNPLVKTVGILLVLYFALFANREHPKSLGNRLSPENIKKDYQEVSEKGQFIYENIQAARKLSQDMEVGKSKAEQGLAVVDTSTGFVVNDLELGAGDKSASCGDEADISYGIYAANGQQIDFVGTEKLIIGSHTRSFFEAQITGMKNGGIRYINISKDAQIPDQQIMQIITKIASDVKVQLILKSFSPTTSQNLSCN